MSLLVVGSVAFDGVETPHGKNDRMLGGAASYIALSACHFAPVRMVACAAPDYLARECALKLAARVTLDRPDWKEATLQRANDFLAFLLARPTEDDPEHDE